MEDEGCGGVEGGGSVLSRLNCAVGELVSLLALDAPSDDDLSASLAAADKALGADLAEGLRLEVLSRGALTVRRPRPTRTTLRAWVPRCCRLTAPGPPNRMPRRPRRGGSRPAKRWQRCASGAEGRSRRV